MPVYLMLECFCDETNLGDELVVVGNIPQLGSWDAKHGLTLTTNATLFPRWVFLTPMLLANNPADLPYSSLEYKYVIRESSGSLRWEDFGILDVPIFSSSASAAANLKVLEHSRARPLNRRILCWTTLRQQKAHGAAVRVDRFRSYEVCAEDACCGPRDWNPGRAGLDGGALQLHGCDEEVQQALHRSLSGMRSLLLGVLLQLARKHALPTELWLCIRNFTGHDAPPRVLLKIGGDRCRAL
mmetsp:Transcript_47145/g.105767  ORF Transcript_47145/g.105767 Transcript_47145/m.105767 type:complete len:241 (-) Transcript_47145:9-731(-)